ncbi:MAG: response regulator [Oligoflexia bacterium]|nr:response regulator [Oligoflexia bacterium]
MVVNTEPNNMRFLIVDDMLTIRTLTKEMLHNIGYVNILDAENGISALDIMDSSYKAGKPIEFVISDWNMPQMDGLTFLKTLRASSTYKTIPFLMVTSESEKECVVAAVKAGIDNFILKPFTAPILREKIDRILSKRKEQQK